MHRSVQLGVIGIVLGSTAPALAADPDWPQVAAALGKAGTEMPGGVYRVGLPRSDLHVTVDGVAIRPTFALGGWLAFARMGGEAMVMVMGDLVLVEPEINPVMSRLAASGIMVTALHNHMLRAQPATFYMHVSGHGDAVKLAAALHDALAASVTPMPAAATPAATPAPAPLDLDTAALDAVLGYKGANNGGVYQFGIPRADVITAGGMAVPPAMGTAIVINFQPIGSGRAAITGDFTPLAEEVNPVLATLRENGIEVAALHNHMLDDQPHTFYAHFWAVDDATKLAKGLRAVLDKVNVAKS
jgi:hypothetical protein